METIKFTVAEVDRTIRHIQQLKTNLADANDVAAQYIDKYNRLLNSYEELVQSLAKAEHRCDLLARKVAELKANPTVVRINKQCDGKPSSVITYA